MRWIDGHLDLAYLQLRGRDLTKPCIDASGCISLPALREAGIDIAFATIFTEPTASIRDLSCYPGSDDLDAAEEAGLLQLQIYEKLEHADEVEIVRSRNDLTAASALPKLVLLMEGADPIRSPADASRWYERGLRMVGLTWAAGTRYAGGNDNHGPLTSLGTELVGALDDLGMIHDASHLADEAFDGLLEHATGPIVATHSNCRALLNDRQRHLRDDQIRTIGDRGGIIGLNLYTSFLARGRRATIDDCIAHVQHVADVMGHRQGVALGSDADGGFSRDKLPIDVDHPTKFCHLAQGLRDAGWSHAEVAGFAHDNWMRFLNKHL